MREKYWEEIRTANAAESLLDGATDEVERARLLAAMNKVSGAWLNALPISSMGLRMDDSTLRIAVGLRLGTAICAPHICQLCGAEVTPLGTHGLSCRVSKGQHLRHSTVNSIIQRTLSAAGVPSRLEPPGLSRSDGKRPDGWHDPGAMELGSTFGLGCHLPRHLRRVVQRSATTEAGCVAAHAEERKSGNTHTFCPLIFSSQWQ